MPGKNFAGVCYPAPVPDSIVDESVTVPQLFSLKGKVASITGASRGIGYAVAEAYAQAGANVAIWYNSTDPKDKAEFLEKKYNVKVLTYKADVTDSDAVDATIAQQISDFGKIDIFVANSGITWTGGPLIDADGHDEWNSVRKTDFDSVYYCSRAIGRHFRDRGTGSLIFTASISGSIVTMPQRQACYNANKAAVIHLMKSLAVEFAPFARVNSVSPGYVKTDILQFSTTELIDSWLQSTPMGRFALPKEMGGAYLFLASDASTYVTGTDLIIDGGSTAW